MNPTFPFALATALVLLGGVRSRGVTAEATHRPEAPSTAAASASGWLQFLDGSSLHGRLRSVDDHHALRWQHPAARDIITFRPANIAVIGFENPPDAPPISPLACRFHFRNGDELFGTLSSFDSKSVELESWSAGALKAARRSVQSITFLPRGFKIRYEGPAGFAGWKLGRDPQAWQYRDGAFVATGTGTLARDFHVEGSSSLEFDLAWNGAFELILILYTDVLDRLDYNVSSYMFYLGPGFVNVQRVQTGFGVVQLGQAQLPDMLKKKRAHFELRLLKEDATLELLVDGTLAQRWKDSRGFVAQGTGIVFFPQLEGSSGGLRLSNLRVCSWDGGLENDAATNATPTNDWVYLVNHDKMSGTLRGLHDGKLTVATAQTPLDIPLSRVARIVLGNATTNPPQATSGLTRAYFVGGGSLSFQLEKWEAQQVSGDSDVFGHVTLRSPPIRRLQFNLDRSATANAEGGRSGKGDDTWDE